MEFDILTTGGWSTPALTYYPGGEGMKHSLVFSFLKWELTMDWGRGI